MLAVSEQNEPRASREYTAPIESNNNSQDDQVISTLINLEVSIRITMLTCQKITISNPGWISMSAG